MYSYFMKNTALRRHYLQYHETMLLKLHLRFFIPHSVKKDCNITFIKTLTEIFIIALFFRFTEIMGLSDTMFLVNSGNMTDWRNTYNREKHCVQ